MIISVDRNGRGYRQLGVYNDIGSNIDCVAVIGSAYGSSQFIVSTGGIARCCICGQRYAKLNKTH